MENDPLQQLRDIHLPSDPSWWPPAVGWWILLAMALYALYRLLQYLIRRHRALAPLRHSHSLLESLYARHRDGDLTAHAYAHEANEVLKRLLVRGYDAGFAAKLSGDSWLQLLDGISKGDQFSSGPGRALGDVRFRAEPQIDATSLHEVLRKLLKQAQPNQVAALAPDAHAWEQSP